MIATGLGSKRLIGNWESDKDPHTLLEEGGGGEKLYCPACQTSLLLPNSTSK